MRVYELTVISKGGFDLEVFLKKLKIKVLKADKPVERPLAYDIKKQKKAVYSYCEVEMSPSAVKDLETKLKLDDNVLRHLIVVREV